MLIRLLNFSDLKAYGKIAFPECPSYIKLIKTYYTYKHHYIIPCHILFMLKCCKTADLSQIFSVVAVNKGEGGLL